MRRNIFIVILLLLLLFLASYVSLAREEQPLVTMLLFETDLREALNEIACRPVSLSLWTILYPVLLLQISRIFPWKKPLI